MLEPARPALMGDLPVTRLVHGISKELLRAAFCDYFGLRDEHADILVLLYERPGEAISTRDLAKLLNSHRPPTRGAVHERIRFIREILEPESLDSGGYLDNSGYLLTEGGIAECAMALFVMAEALTKAGPAAIINGARAEQIRSASLRTDTKAA